MGRTALPAAAAVTGSLRGEHHRAYAIEVFAREKSRRQEADPAPRRDQEGDRPGHRAQAVGERDDGDTARRRARHPRGASSGDALTTVAGRAGRRHRQQPAGRLARPDAARGLPPPREDHALRPRAHPRARGARPRRRRPTAGSSSRVARRHHLRRVPQRHSVRRRRCSCASRPSPARAAPPTPPATCAASRRSSTRSEGNWDLVGNNIPVFFIQDGIKFPDIIHAAKPEPDREIPQAQTAHDTFWDFVSLTPESTHMLMWVMSDRAIPRSYRTMEGFGVHTFRLVNAEGETTPREVPLEAGGRRPLAGVGGVAEARRHRPRLPPPRPVERDRGRRVPAVGPRRAGHARHRGPDLRGHRPARPDQDRARGAVPGAARRHAHARPQPHQLLRRDRAGRVLHRALRARHRLHRRSAAAGPRCSPTSTPSSPGSAARTSTSSRSTGPRRR